MIRKVVIVACICGALLSQAAWVADTIAPRSITILESGSNHAAGQRRFWMVTIHHRKLWLAKAVPRPTPLASFHGEFLGFVVDRSPVLHTTRDSLAVPLSAITLAMLTYPTIVFIRGPVRRWRRRRKGLCVKCGYDLTGNVTGVCSECGKSLDGMPVQIDTPGLGRD